MTTEKKILIFLIFLCLKIYAQNTFSLQESLEIDSLIKKDQWDLVHMKLSNEDNRFRRLSKYPLSYHFLIKLDSASVLYKHERYTESKQTVLSIQKQIDQNKANLGLSRYESLKYIGITRLFYIEKRMGNIGQGLQYLETLSQGMSPIYKKKQNVLIAVAYRELGNYKKSIDILNNLLKDLQTGPDNPIVKKQEMAAGFNNKGEAFTQWYKDTGKVQMLDSSQRNYEKAYSLMKDSPHLSSSSKTLYTSRQAELAMLKKQYSKSLYLFNQCQKDSSFMKKKLNSEAIWFGKAEVFTFLNKPDSAFQYIYRLQNKNSQPKNTYENKLKIYHILSMNYENIGDHRNAYQFAKLSLSEMDKKKKDDSVNNDFLGLYEQNEIKYASNEVIEEKTKTFILIINITIISGFLLIFMFRQYKKREINPSQEPLQPVSIPKVPENNNQLCVKTNNNVIIDQEIIHRTLKKLETMETSQKFLLNSFKLNYIAKQLNTNTVYLSHIIKQYKGVSFKEYVNNLRINYIKQELKENPKLRLYTIQYIAEKTGYRTSTTFSKAFKERQGITPSEFIRTLDQAEKQEGSKTARS